MEARPSDHASTTQKLKKKNSDIRSPGSTGYRKEDYEKITTVEHIWQCDWSLLHEKGQRLKDLCLSMALSKMLNRRFAGFELAEAGLEKTRDFVFRGLLVAGEKPHERAFRVIEEELAFVHDLYYTKYPYLYRKGRVVLALCLPVTMVTLCSWITCELYVHFELLQKRNGATPNSYVYLHTTLVLMAGVTLLEGFQLYLHMASGWFKVALIRGYLPVMSRPEGFFYQKIVGLVLSLKALRPWERKIGQYCLLGNFDGTRRASTCLHYATLCLVDKAKKGLKGGKRVSLRDEMKQAVIDSLVQSGGHLTNGVRSLERNGVHEKLSWACWQASDGTAATTRTILVWHIATTFCMQQLPALSQVDRTAVDKASLVATSLSGYCAYLVALEPNLLPDHSADSASILQETIAEACSSSLRGASKEMQSKCEKLMRLVKDADAHAHADAYVSLVVRGGRLARQLTEDIRGPSLRWKVLSEFWAEMMLYVAPCEDAQARAHLEALARGGEFITHLWALLTHAGVLKRDPMATVV